MRTEILAAQCSQRGTPSVLSQDEDGRLFAVPSRPPAKLPDDSEWRTSGPTVPHRYISPCNVSVWPFDSCARICFETKRQELRQHKIVSPIPLPRLSLSRLPSSEYRTRNTRSRTAVMTKGLLHTLNWAETGSVEYTWNCASIKIPNGLMRDLRVELTYDTG